MLPFTGAGSKPAAKYPVREAALDAEETRLIDFIERAARNPDGRYAAHIRLSSLLDHQQRDYRVRIATDAIEQALRFTDARIFKLHNRDLVVVLTTDEAEQFEATFAKLHYLFGDEESSEGLTGVSEWFELQTESEALLALASRLRDQIPRQSRGPGGRLKPIVSDEAAPIDPQNLSALIQAISTADLSGYLRRQTVYALLRDQPPQALFQELFMSIGDLHKTLLPTCDLSANRWLFQYLTETLDRRMLSLLVSGEDRSLTRCYSLNLNISTLLSADFLEFDRSLTAGARGTIILELQPIDIFADPAAFSFARDFAQNRGYKICLDSLDVRSFSLLDRVSLGLDLVKLNWTSDLGTKPERHEQLCDLVERTGKAKVILCHVDTEAAVEFGQSIGIALFQGRHIDQMNAPRYVQTPRRPWR